MDIDRFDWDDWIVKVTTKSVKVLIVDDQEMFRGVARLVIDMAEGFEVAGEASTGEQAVELAEDLPFDLVLMDMNLPGIDGPEATRQILRTRPETKVVGLSTYDEYHDRAIDAGAVAFVSKSEFEPGILAEIWAGS